MLWSEGSGTLDGLRLTGLIKEINVLRGMDKTGRSEEAVCQRFKRLEAIGTLKADTAKVQGAIVSSITSTREEMAVLNAKRNLSNMSETLRKNEVQVSKAT